MGIGIMFEMSEMIVVLRYEPIKNPEHIGLYVRIGILVYRQSARRVFYKKYADAVLKALFRDGRSGTRLE